MAAGWVVKVEGQRCDVMYVSLNAVFVMESLGNLFKKKKSVPGFYCQTF